jgi:hypothetical protein
VWAGACSCVACAMLARAMRVRAMRAGELRRCEVVVTTKHGDDRLQTDDALSRAMHVLY